MNIIAHLWKYLAPPVELGGERLAVERWRIAVLTPRKLGDADILPITVRVKEASRLTGIGRSKLYLLMNEGAITKIKVGPLTLIPMKSLEAFLHRGGS